MNKIIHSQLEEIFNYNFKKLEDVTFEIMIEDFIQGMGENLQQKGLIDDPLYNEDVLNLVKYKGNKELIDAFEKAKKLDLDEVVVKRKLTIDIISSIHQLNETVFSKNEQLEKHSIYIVIGNQDDPEDEIYTKGSLCGLKEEYSFLSEVDTLIYVHDGEENNDEIYTDVGFIDFSPILKNLVDLKNLFLNHDLNDSLICTATYYYLRTAYEYKLYVLLNEVFEDIKIDFFKSESIVPPLQIYALELFGEGINVYVYE